MGSRHCIPYSELETVGNVDRVSSTDGFIILGCVLLRWRDKGARFPRLRRKSCFFFQQDTAIVVHSNVIRNVRLGEDDIKNG